MSSSSRIKSQSASSGDDKKQKEKQHKDTKEEEPVSSSKDVKKKKNQADNLDEQGRKDTHDESDRKIPAAPTEITKVIGSRHKSESPIAQQRGTLSISSEEEDSAQIPSRPSSAFERNMQGWEVTISSFTESRGDDIQTTTERLEQLHVSKELSGDDVDDSRRTTPPRFSQDFSADVGREMDDQFLMHPIEFKHTQSTPLQYSQMIDEDDEDEMIFPDVSPMKRSSSTPSSFQPSFPRSSFGRHIRLDGHGASAFSQPPRRWTGSMSSDRGSFSSAFDPVWSSKSIGSQESEGGIPLVSPVHEKEAKPAAQPTHASAQPESDTNLRKKKSQQSIASRTSKLFRRRRFRSGRENPARPPSTSSSSKETEDDIVRKDSINESDMHGVVQASSSEGGGSPPLDKVIDKYKILPVYTDEEKTLGAQESGMHRSHSHVGVSPSVDSDDEHEDDGALGQAMHSESISGSYQPLGSHDADDEAGSRPQSIASSSTLGPLPTLGESPTQIPSPAYEEFVDDLDEDPLPPLRDVSRHYRHTSKTPPHISSPTLLGLAVHSQDSNLSPASHGSESQSRVTTRSALSNNTSSQTHTTTTSGTLSSDQASTSATITSSVAEADREVMEVNRRERLHRQQGADVDGAVSINSSSTTGSIPNGYVALSHSPASLRNGATLPVDRFFAGTSIPLTPSAGSNLSSIGPGSVSIPEQAAAHLNSKKPATRGNIVSRPGTGSPMTISSSSMAHTTSSSSTGDEPPRFVSYLERPPPSPAVPVKVGTATRLRMQVGAKDEGKGSESPIDEYSQIVWEEATAGTPISDSIKTAQPPKKRETLKKKWIKLKSKPPRSPVKVTQRASSSCDGSNEGYRSPTSTPPPQAASVPPNSNDASTPRSPLPILDSHSQHDLQKRGAARPHVRRSNVGDISLKRNVILVPPSAIANDGRFPAPRSATVAPSPIPRGIVSVQTNVADTRPQATLADSGVITVDPGGESDVKAKGQSEGETKAAIVTPEKS